jgi:MoxR-like ATPase
MSQEKPIAVTVALNGKDFIIKDLSGADVTGVVNIPVWMLRKAAKEKVALVEHYTKSGELQWRRKPVNVARAEMNFAATDTSKSVSQTAEAPVLEIPTEHKTVVKFIQDSYKLKPKGLIISELKWRFLVRNALRCRNILIVGDSGAGKTFTAKSLAKVLARPSEIFNLGATQDPRSYLIGNTHFDKERGTYFAESLFVKMCRTPNSIIILDELTRAHPDAHNILMPVLDVNQRYLRLEEKDDSETVPLAEGVTFISTANIGAKYTATRVLDQAMFERHEVVEMDLLTKPEEIELLTYMYPMLDAKKIAAVASIVTDTRHQMESEAPKLDHSLSTRTSIALAGLLFDGFRLAEACEIAVFPFYDKEGGTESPRLFIKQLVQKYISVDEQASGTPDPDEEEPLFSDDEVNNAPTN